ncbi:MAG: ferredoxin [Firmicutes bacterium HGW-Firmicutes-2]|jgi:NADH-quinone oxidoreductase subunit G/NADP-reducing hydrogenase subunit HndD|nr:MAG: ferredoxin [Firmicutes bacterium HGW-Firmicutes-2]
MVSLKINNKVIEADENATIMEAAKANGILIPSLCYLEGVHQVGSCRICVVEVEGSKNLQASCITKVREGMTVKTNTQEVRKVRKVVYELMMSDHDDNCLVCSRSGSCEFQELGEWIQLQEENPYQGAHSKLGVKDISNPSIERDLSKCILCRRCITVCNEIQGIGIMENQNRGFDSFIGPTEGFELMDINCTFCGQCTTVCPVGALKEKDATVNVWEALLDKNKRVVVQTAPAVRAALGEEFGYEPGTLVTGKMAAALRELGFDDVFDTNFAADLTILEEGTELLMRLKALISGEETSLPMITSCSPGWIKYVEHKFPDQLDHLSSCKSPHMMLGALAKSYYANQLGMDAKDMFVVSVMPCTAKKYEITREEMLGDVDAVLTTRELAKMIKDAGIDFVHLDDEHFDNPMGLSSGAADIFGTTGGVMEAALRTVYEIITGTEMPYENLHVQSVMGLEGIKEGSLFIEKTTPEWSGLEGVTVRYAAASGLSNAKILLEQIREEASPYHFIEIMACPGGCISGGGQPRLTTQAIREKRMAAIYREDEGKTLRKSHENEAIIHLYETYLKAPLGHKSHELLHTHYVKRNMYSK